MLLCDGSDCASALHVGCAELRKVRRFCAACWLHLHFFDCRFRMVSGFVVIAKRVCVPLLLLLLG